MAIKWGELGRVYGFTFLVVLIPVAIFVFFLPDQYSPTTVEWIDDDDVPETHRNKVLRRPKTTAQILVLGDIGRSPRMQYHALSLASHGARVDLVGYLDSEVHPSIASSTRINIVPLTPFPSFLRTNSKLLFLLLGPLKVLFQSLTLWRALAYTSKSSKYLLVQNPPSIPTLLIASLACYFRNTALVIDWHNFGYSLLALRLSPSHPLVTLSRYFEKYFATFATSHFAVTHAMFGVLWREFGIPQGKITTLHDRPQPLFQPLSAPERQIALHQLAVTAPHATEILTGQKRLLVSSTSWTPDEDFSLLLDALVSYSKHSRRNTTPSLPSLLVIITGKGPQKEHYLSRISSLTRSGDLKNITILTAWLSTTDYARLLGAADLGVSLHTSSSGVDLPMKVVDMFGAGLPVVAMDDFEACKELVKEGLNGRGFKTSEELGELLVELMGKGDAGRQLGRLKEGAVREGDRRWEQVWDATAGRVFGVVENDGVVDDGK